MPYKLSNPIELQDQYSSLAMEPDDLMAKKTILLLPLKVVMDNRSGSVCLNNFPRTISGALGVYNSAELSTVAHGACDVPAGAVGNSGRTNRFHSMQPLRVWAC
jgi:hypothetical protein